MVIIIDPKRTLFASLQKIRFLARSLYLLINQGACSHYHAHGGDIPVYIQWMPEVEGGKSMQPGQTLCLQLCLQWFSLQTKQKHVWKLKIRKESLNNADD